MDIRFSGQNLKISDGMKEHLQKHLGRLEKYAPRLIDAHVFLKKEKYFYKTEITLLAQKARVFGEGSSKENIFAAMDEAYERVENQLKKIRAKNKDHHKKRNKSSITLSKTADLLESERASLPRHPRIVRSSDFATKPMSVEEASMQLELSPESFLVFLNQNTETINVIYKRRDGDYGLIEPRF